MYRLIFLLMFSCVAGMLFADEPNEKKQPPNESTSDERAGAEPPTEPPPFELSEDVREVLSPLFSSIVKAKVSRATVEMLVDSLLSGSVIESQESTFQIASSVDPDKFTVYLKEPEQRTRIYCDSKSIAVALAPDAYFRLPDAIGTQDAVVELPVPMGPYPEPVLALTLAGVDPAISLVGGMKSIEIVDREDFRGAVPSIHLRGVQADAVSWDFWITREKAPKPLRFLVDLTPMLIASDQVQVPEGFSYQVRFDFLTWRMTGEIDDRLFTYVPSKEAKEYDSLEHYYESLAGVTQQHPLLGKPAPRFQAVTLDGKKVDSKALADKVVVLDFWATWCAPCVAAMPIIKAVADDFAEQGVVFIALNTGEEKEKVVEFLKEHELDVNVLLDPEGEVADAFSADAIPQTILIGKGGAIESVHVGFAGEEALKQRLTDELEVLSIGGLIGSVPADADQQTSKDSGAADAPPGRQESKPSSTPKREE